MAFTVDKFGSKRYTSRKTDVVRVVPKHGQEYTITPLATELDGQPFMTHIFEPEDPKTPDLTLVAYGLGENSGVGEGEAHAMAMLGIPNTLHDTPRTQVNPELRDIILNPRLLKDMAKSAINPLILPSKALSEVADVAQDYQPKYKKIKVKARSMGAVTGSMFAAHDDRVDSLLLDGPGGIATGNALLNHATGAYGIATKEIPPAVRGVMQHASKETIDRIGKHFTSNLALFGHEVLFMVAKTPDISELLKEAHDKGVNITIMNHEEDQFFEDQNMVRSISRLMKRGIVDRHHRSLGTRHVFGIEKPHESAQLYYDLMIGAKLAASQPQLATATN